jgi:hypothetical protein
MQLSRFRDQRIGQQLTGSVRAEVSEVLRLARSKPLCQLQQTAGHAGLGLIPLERRSHASFAKSLQALIARMKAGNGELLFVHIATSPQRPIALCELAAVFASSPHRYADKCSLRRKAENRILPSMGSASCSCWSITTNGSTKPIFMFLPKRFVLRKRRGVI